MSGLIQVVNKETGAITEYTEANFIVERDRLLVEWQKKQAELATVKAEEMALRVKCVEFISNPNLNKGTERVPLGNGYEAKVVKKITYGFQKTVDGKIDKKAIDAALTAIEDTGDVGKYIADQLVKWTPELSLTEYNKLNDNIKALIDPVIRTTDGTPTLEILEPKTKK